MQATDGQVLHFSYRSCTGATQCLGLVACIGFPPRSKTRGTNRAERPPKGPFRTKKTTTIAKIVNYYAVVFFTTPPPNLLRRGPFLERKEVCNSQEMVLTQGAPRKCNSKFTTRSKFTIGVVFLVRRGPLGMNRTPQKLPPSKTQALKSSVQWGQTPGSHSRNVGHQDPRPMERRSNSDKRNRGTKAAAASIAISKLLFGKGMRRSTFQWGAGARPPPRGGPR